MPVIECAQACTVTLTMAAPDFEAWGITPVALASAFGFGVASVFSLWALGYVTSVVIKLIKAL